MLSASLIHSALKAERWLSLGAPAHLACGISHVLGQLNYLSDKTSQHHMTMATVCAAFGVSQSTASAKARVNSDALHTNRIDPTWMLKSIVDGNRFVGWLRSIGLLVDVRDSAGDRLREGHDPLHRGRAGITSVPADRPDQPGQAGHAFQVGQVPAR